MEFEKWDRNKHAELVPYFFSEHVVEPKKTDKYKNVISIALEDIEEIYGVKADFKIVFAEIDVEKFREQFNGDIPPHVFFRGYSKSETVHGEVDENLMFLATSDKYEHWEPGLKDLVVHEESHFEFFRIWGSMDNAIWGQILFEGHAKFREKEVIEKKDYYWQGRQDSFNGRAEKVGEELDKVQTRDNPNCMFNFGGEKWPDAKGYVIALDVYRNLINRQKLDTNDLLRKDREWLRDKIEESVNNLYGEE